MAWRLLRARAPSSIRTALVLEFRIIQHLLAEDDFHAGVRAVLVEKSRRPRWGLASLADVSEAEVERHFESIGERELSFG